MKTIRKIMEGVAAACISVAMYYCFLSGAPAGGTERTVYMILDGIFCISAWVAGVGILWYVRWLRRRNKELENMIKDFQSKQFEMQAKQLSGGQLTPEDMAGVQQLYAILLKDPLAAGYIEAEMRFSLMMKDVYEILGEATGMGDMLG